MSSYSSLLTALLLGLTVPALADPPTSQPVQQRNGWDGKHFTYERPRVMVVEETTPTAEQVDYTYGKRPTQLPDSAKAPAAARQPAKPAVMGTMNVVRLRFRDLGGRDVPLLLTTPKDKKGPFPVVIALHGLGSNKAQVTAQIGPALVKQGFAVLAMDNVRIIETVADAIKANQLAPYVCDPVMVAKSGSVLLNDDAVSALRTKLFPLATVVTPNRHEAAKLLNTAAEALNSVAAAKEAAKRLAGAGARAVVIKGIAVGTQMIDLLYDGKEYLEFADELRPGEKSHGSGCAFSAAICAGLANRLSLIEAVDQAKQLVNMAIQYSDGQGRGTAPVNVLAFKPRAAKK